jgi:hypothetical protein
MALSHLIIHTHYTDQPLDFLDEDEFVCTYTPDESEILESLDDAINAQYRQLMG